MQDMQAAILLKLHFCFLFQGWKIIYLLAKNIYLEKSYKDIFYSQEQ